MKKAQAEYLAKGFKKESDKSVFHVELSMPKFNSETGERLDTPIIQKYGPETFKKRSAGFKRLGYVVQVLYNPTEYNNANKEKQAEARAKREEAAIERIAAAKAEQAANAKMLEDAKAIVEGEAIKKEAEKLAAEKLSEKDSEIAKLKAELAASTKTKTAANNEPTPASGK